MVLMAAMNTRSEQPSVWCLLGRKAGDNAQVRALAEEIGFPMVEKTLCAQPWEWVMHLGSFAGLGGIDRRSSSLLEAPWPDLLITSGRRNEPVANWIRRQSGGHTKLVHIGRPWFALDNYEFVVTTPQYFLPHQSNIVHNQLPLYRLLPSEIQTAQQQFAPRWQHLPRPWFAVLVGGDSGRFVFTLDKARHLGRECNRLAEAAGGSLLISDSPRTSTEAGNVLLEHISVPHFSYRCAANTENPYRAFLAEADEFVVTGESMSMLAETASQGKPLHIFDMGDGDMPWWQLRHNYRHKPLSHRLAMRFGPVRMRRDVGKIQQALVRSGRANWLGSTTSTPPPATADGELASTAELIRRRLQPG
ncbi:MAG: mitochondrial fission protein ELM1 [Halioglobus sp.]|jgi:mitochondrial fission protein ELM1